MARSRQFQLYVNLFCLLCIFNSEVSIPFFTSTVRKETSKISIEVVSNNSSDVLKIKKNKKKINEMILLDQGIAPCTRQLTVTMQIYASLVSMYVNVVLDRVESAIILRCTFFCQRDC